MNFEGQNISLHDALFVDNITGDLESFRVRSSSIARVLVFPPVNNYHRFLVHKVVETGFPQFTTFSVGEGLERRTVVCFQQHLLEHTLKQAQNLDQALETHTSITEAESEEIKSTDLEKSSVEEEKVDPCNENGETVGGEGTGRIEESSAANQTDLETLDKKVDEDDSANEADVNSPCDRVEEEEGMKIENEDDSESKDDSNKSGTPASDAVIPNENGYDSQSKSQGDDAKKRRSKRPAMAVYVPPRGRSSTAASSKPSTPVKSSTSNTPVRQLPTKKGTQNDKSIVPDDLDVTEQVVSEITVAVGGVQIEGPEVNYLSFQTSDSTINIDQFGHVIELYDFPSEYKTNNLVDAFPAFTSRWDIKWVDDTHALGVFSSSEAAAEALAVRHPSILTRPLNMATPQSKCKARSVLEELLPYKPRPVSCTAPARRLLQWALGSGMRVPEASKQENERLREARRRKEEGKRRESSQNEDIKKRREEVLQVRVEKKYRHDEHDHR